MKRHYRPRRIWPKLTLWYGRVACGDFLPSTIVTSRKKSVTCKSCRRALWFTQRWRSK
jgi:hypothetical protein